MGIKKVMSYILTICMVLGYITFTLLILFSFVGSLFAEELRDVNPPYFQNWIPEPGATGVNINSQISVTVLDCDGPEISGVNVEAIVMTIIIGADTLILEHTDLILNPADCGGFHILYYYHSPFPECTEIYVHIEAEDLAGLYAEDEMTFTTAGCIDDIWAPCFVEWFPDTCVIPGAPIGVAICDVCDGADATTGVDPETIEAFIIMGSDTIDVTPAIVLEGIYCAGYALHFTLPLEWILPDTFELCVFASDFAGNRTHACHLYNACVEPPPGCTPRFVEVTPHIEASNVPVEHGINMVFGPQDTLCRYVCWDTMSFHGTLNINGVIINLGPGDVGFWMGDHPFIGIEYHHPENWPPGATVQGIWAIADCDGNYEDGHFYFNVETIPHEDIWEPCFVEWSPHTDCITPGTMISFAVCDVCEGSESSTGVSLESMIVLLIIHGDTINVTPHVETEPILCNGYDVFLETSGDYPPGTDFEICVYVEDIAGNDAHACHVYHICSDNCSPIATLWWPPAADSCYPSDVAIDFRAVDPAEPGTDCPICTGIVIESLWVSLYNNGEIYDLYPGAGLYFDPRGDCEYYVRLEHEYFVLEEGPVEIGVHLLDGAGNHGYSTHSFNICPPPPEDTWAPCFLEWMPDTCAVRSSTFSVAICDVCAGADFHSGVNPESIEVLIIFGTDTINVTEHLVLEPIECAGYEIFLEALYEYIPAGVWIEGYEFQACVSASDMAGNTSHQCHIYDICDITPPEDLCAPNVVEFHPPEADTCFPADVPIFFTIIDPANPGTDCPVCSGIDAERLWVRLNFGDAFVTLYPDSGLILEWVSDCRLDVGLDPEYYELPEGIVTMQMLVCDIAGNCHDPIFSFNICAEDEDIWPPCFLEWMPDTCVGAEGVLSVAICDLCPEVEIASGVNPETIEAIINAGGETYDVTEFIALDPIYCAGYQLLLEIPAYLSDVLLPGTEFQFCVHVSDHAGNRGHGCHYYSICGTHPYDCRPIFVELAPPMGAWDVPVEHGINMVFAPRDIEHCPEICWDPESFYGWLTVNVYPETDTIFLGPENVDFWYGDPPNVHIEYHYPEDWPFGAEVHGEWSIADCEGHFADGSVYFHVETDEPVDETPPCYTNWNPRDCVEPGGTVTVDVCDICDTPGFHSGVALESIEIIIIWLDDTINVTEFGHEPLECDGFRLFIDTSLWGIPGIFRPYDTNFTICVYASDVADNRSHSCHTFTICGEPPDCNPEFIEVTPPLEAMNIPVEHGINMVFGPIDEECDSICWDTESFSGWLTIHTSSGVDTIYLGPDDVEFWFGEFPYIGIEYHYPENWHFGAEVRGAFLIGDCEGHMADGHIIFTVEPEEPVDLSPPCFIEWRPEECVVPGGPIHVNVCDACPEVEMVTGVDPESIEMIIIVRGDTLDVSEFFALEAIDCAGYMVQLDTHEELVPGTEFIACVYASDLAGNRSHACHVYNVCETPPEDICPPEVVEFHPVPRDTCYTPEVLIDFTVVDPAEPGTECPECSGIDVEELWVRVHSGEETYMLYPDEGLILDPGELCELFVALDPDYYTLAEGTANITIYVCDIAGNCADPHFTINVCGEAPEDIWDPCISAWRPDGCLEPGDPITVDICDACEYSEFASGVDPETVEMVLVFATDTVNVTEFISLDVIRCMGYQVTLDAFGDLFPGTEFSVCLDASDMAGNHAHDCHDFVVCDSTTPPDCTPMFVSVVPIPGALDMSPTAGINMIFGPADDDCESMCWDTLSFHGLLLIHTFPGIDTVELGPADVGFWLGDYPFIGIEYHYPGGYPLGSEVHGSWAIADCEETFADGMVYFHVEGEDSTDIWAPCMHEWNPEACLEPGSSISVAICDVCDYSRFSTGVDPESIEMIAFHEGDTLDVTEYLVLEEIECMGYMVSLETPEELPAGIEFGVCVGASDFAGNRAHNCHIFNVCDTTHPEDLCSPEVLAWHPGDADSCFPPEVPVSISIVDPEEPGTDCPFCSGIDTDELWVRIENGEEVFELTPGEGLFLAPEGPCYLDVILSRDHYTLEEGEVSLTIHICDIAGNCSNATHSFDICGEPDDSLDVWDPCFSEWFPFSGELVPGGMVGVSICGICPDAEYSTDIDPESVEFGYFIGETWIDVTDDIMLDRIHCLGYSVHYETGDLPEGEVMFCVEASDFAGNRAGDCFTFTVIDSIIPDEYPPCVDGWHPPDGSEAVPPSLTISANICDFCEYSEVATGVDPETIVMTILINSGEFTDTLVIGEELMLEPIDCAGYWVGFEVLPPGFPPGSEVTVILYAEDYAGNPVEDEITFWVGETPPEDTIPPLVAEHEPEDGAEDVELDAEIVIWLCDGWYDTPVYSISGVDSSTITVTIQFGEGEIINITDASEIWSNRCMGYTIEYTPDEAYPEDTEIRVCVRAEDHAGNVLEYCYSFTTGEYEAPDTTDRQGPFGTDWLPMLGASGVDPAAPISVRVLDCHGEFISGVDPASIHMFLQFDALIPIEVTDDITMDIDICGGFRLIYVPEPPLPFGTEVIVAVEALDYAGNPIVPGTDFTHFWTAREIPDTTSDVHYLTGTVRDALTGTPVPNINMRAYPFLSDHEFGFFDVTDELGEYSISVPPGEYCLAALDESFIYYPEFYDGYRSPLDADIIAITPESPDTLFGLDFELDSVMSRYYRITGTIEEEGGGHDPIPGTFVIAVSSEEDEEWSASTFTDREGEYSMKVLNGSYYIFAFKPDYIPLFYEDVRNWAEATAILVDDADVHGINIHLPRAERDTMGIDIEGHVFDGGDEIFMINPPLRGTRLYILDQYDIPVAYTVSNPSGYFKFENMPEGVFKLNADKVGFHPYDEFMYFEDSISDVEITLYRLTSSIPDPKNPSLPDNLKLEQNYPNPFNPVTHFSYYLPSSNEVKIEIVDMMGRKVKELFNGNQTQGRYLVIWNASEVPSGIYFCKLHVGSEVRTIRMNLIK